MHSAQHLPFQRLKVTILPTTKAPQIRNAPLRPPLKINNPLKLTKFASRLKLPLTTNYSKHLLKENTKR